MLESRRGHSCSGPDRGQAERTGSWRPGAPAESCPREAAPPLPAEAATPQGGAWIRPRGWIDVGRHLDPAPGMQQPGKRPYQGMQPPGEEPEALHMRRKAALGCSRASVVTGLLGPWWLFPWHRKPDFPRPPHPFLSWPHPSPCPQPPGPLPGSSGPQDKINVKPKLSMKWNAIIGYLTGVI